MAQFQSTGQINNRGTIVVKGNADIRQDSIGGTVRYAQDRQGFRQNVPAITYENVEFEGVTPKTIVNSNRPLIAHSRFRSTTNAVLTYDEDVRIVARGRVTHDGIINPAALFGEMYLQGVNPQDVDGRGTFKVVDLDNGSGADVINQGGFRIHTRLRLTEGEMRNSPENNFIMSQNSEIVRTDRGSLRSEPIFEGDNTVRYVGAENMSSGGEIPEGGTLKNLLVESSGGILLNKSVTVTDTLVLRSNITVGDTEMSPVILTHSAAIPPEFENDAEIIGAFRRTQLVLGDTRNVFNNAFTSIRLDNITDANGATAITMRVYPNRPPLPDEEEVNKVRRSFVMTLHDEQGDTVQSGFRLNMQFGWRSMPADELNDLPLDRLVLQHWESDRWSSIGNAADTGRAEGAWYAFNVDSVTESGYLAIGRSDTGLPVFISVRVLLEGAARADTMHTRLAADLLLPETPPDRYPYNLDPARNNIRMTIANPENSIVDWVLVEARSALSPDASDRLIRRIGLVRSDGLIVAADGETPLRFEAGDFYIAVHHRNHLAIMTPEVIRLTPTLDDILDLTDPDNVLGGIGAGAKLVTLNGTIRAAMFAGDTNADGLIDEDDDYEFGPMSSWVRRNEEGYLQADTDLSGVVNTKDANINWNNRGTVSQVPR